MKRSKDLIISQILLVCAKGANKTRIVYQANLNFRTVDPYLKLLMERGLINAKRSKERYTRRISKLASLR